MTSLLDFYRQHAISPVAQDIRDLPAHFARRAGLYRSLGLPPIAISGRWVLEIGAGGGHNALYIHSLDPERYVFIEPNATAARELRERFPYRDVVETSIEAYTGASDIGFDLVLCEGLLGLCGDNPHHLLEAAAKHVAPGGALVITCIDPISDHAEVLRRALAHPLIDRTAPLADQVAVLRPVFAPHLATLKGMTRSVDDWIVDNLLNTASIGPTFSIPEACVALEGRFDLMGCSPQFLTDWRWYKTRPAGNDWAVWSYWEQAHNLYDYRVRREPRARARNEDLMEHCKEVRAQVRAYEAGEGPAPRERLTDIGWFGRGQQYVSFVKR